MNLSRSFCISAALVLAAAIVSAAPPPELPVSTFFKKSSITQLTFSPDGKRIACLIPYEHRMNLAVIDLEKKTKNLLTNFKDNDVGSVRWASDDRLLFTQDIDGKEIPSVFAVNRDGSDPLQLFGLDSTAESSAVNLRFRSLLHRIENDPKSFLVLASLTGAQGPDVCKMNIKTGRMTVLVPNPGFVRTWIFDHNDEARVAVSEEGRKRKVLFRAEGRTDWETLDNGINLDPDDVDETAAAGTWLPVAFDGDNRTLFVVGRSGSDRAAVFRYDTISRRLGDKVVEDDTYDASVANPEYNPYPLKGTIYNSQKKKIVGFAYRRDKARVVWFDDDFARLQKQVDASLPDTANFILDASPDDSKQLILAQSDRDPGVYYLFDRAKKKIEELAIVKPGIDPDQMAPMKPMTFTSRDGLTIHAYLTLPVGREPKNLPLVLHPHGGPYGIRDDWRFDPEVQFYANRGFAVLQIDYRGSGGYGQNFEKTGYHKWGLEMQNDLTDGVKWAIAQGLADAQRVVISGASYGGYATMAGLTFTPELYCAGINYVGVTNLTTQWGKYKGTDTELRQVHRLFGDMDKSADSRRAYDTSPSNFADRIRVPVLMAYGRNDPRVNIDQGYDMESALKKAGKPYEMIIERDEGHGFRKEELSIAFYTKVDEFLKKNVPRKGEVNIGPTQVIAMPAKAGS
jgi:dipeptidyl aminopeptidase/acylaminoacyl peptidase